MQLVEKPKSSKTTNPVIRSLMEKHNNTYTNNSITTPTQVECVSEVTMTNAFNLMDDIGIIEYFSPLIRKLAYVLEYNKIYITTNPALALLMKVKNTIDIDMELDYNFDYGSMGCCENWGDFGMFDLYIPDSPLYNLGKIINNAYCEPACQIQLNNTTFAYYYYNRQSLVVGNWLRDKNYIDIIVRKIWPEIVEKLKLAEKKKVIELSPIKF